MEEEKTHNLTVPFFLFFVLGICDRGIKKGNTGALIEEVLKKAGGNQTCFMVCSS